MATVESFVFNMFSENTYVLYDDSKECIIIDPGCYSEDERQRLKSFIEKNNLTPVALINTHCHVDHVFGNRFVAETWGLELTIPEGEQQVLAAFPQVAQMYAIPNIQQSPDPSHLLEEGDEVKFGHTTLKILSTPGHSPASVCLYSEADQFVIAGDVLFAGSIGRTDLPGGDYNTLISSIKNKLLPMKDQVEVFPGHGPSTTIGRERRSNPFLQ
jgi:hydroxyacylglutathione hydrolase